MTRVAAGEDSETHFPAQGFIQKPGKRQKGRDLHGINFEPRNPFQDGVVTPAGLLQIHLPVEVEGKNRVPSNLGGR